MQLAKVHIYLSFIKSNLIFDMIRKRFKCTSMRLFRDFLFLFLFFFLMSFFVSFQNPILAIFIRFCRLHFNMYSIFILYFFVWQFLFHLFCLIIKNCDETNSQIRKLAALHTLCTRLLQQRQWVCNSLWVVGLTKNTHLKKQNVCNNAIVCSPSIGKIIFGFFFYVFKICLQFDTCIIETWCLLKWNVCIYPIENGR